jgi:hypothetical protein
MEKKDLDDIYSVGFKNGQIEMRNKILKSINRDWNLLPHAALAVKLMKKINKLRISKPKL